MKIQITLISVSDIKNVDNVDIFPNSKVYAVAWIEDGSRPAKQKTAAKEYGTNPNWNKLMSFIVDEEALEQDHFRLKLELISKKTIGGKKVGDVSIQIKFLGKFNTGRVGFWSYRVRDPSGKITGKLNMTFQVIKPELESNTEGSTTPQRKKRKKVPLTKPEPKSNAKGSPTPQRKERNKLALRTRVILDFTSGIRAVGFKNRGNFRLYNPPYPPYTLPHCPQQAGYPYPPCPPYTPMPDAGYTQYLTPGGQYPPQ
ncbi:uncharacterized protein LOC131048805 [Cryptomeria japonica]|uniref:uncharacterized protein LOC131048805 n=1 Tax=Cryptomeria japonica TaxID=3369 RepID=UPI0027D9FE0D|nr:uncharacterized protein LOC131048805 [Cryptomeria japonica]